jgi:hypothetical protein
MCVSWLFEPQGCLPDDPNKIATLVGAHHGTVKRFLSKFPFFFEPVTGLLAGNSPHSRHFPAESPPNLRRFLAVFAPFVLTNGGLLGNAKLLVQSVSYWELSEKRAKAARLAHANTEHLHEQTGGSAFASASASPSAKAKPLNPGAKPAPPPVDTRHPECIEFASKTFEVKHSQRPTWTARDFKALKELLAHPNVTVFDFQRRWTNYLESTEPFTVKQGDALWYFCSKYDTFLEGPIAERRNGNGRKPADEIFRHNLEVTKRHMH